MFDALFAGVVGGFDLCVIDFEVVLVGLFLDWCWLLAVGICVGAV